MGRFGFFRISRPSMTGIIIGLSIIWGKQKGSCGSPNVIQNMTKKGKARFLLNVLEVLSEIHIRTYKMESCCVWILLHLHLVFVCYVGIHLKFEILKYLHIPNSIENCQKHGFSRISIFIIMYGLPSHVYIYICDAFSFM